MPLFSKCVSGWGKTSSASKRKLMETPSSCVPVLSSTASSYTRQGSENKEMPCKSQIVSVPGNPVEFGLNAQTNDRKHRSEWSLCEWHGQLCLDVRVQCFLSWKTSVGLWMKIMSVSKCRNPEFEALFEKNSWKYMFMLWSLYVVIVPSAKLFFGLKVPRNLTSFCRLPVQVLQEDCAQLFVLLRAKVHCTSVCWGYQGLYISTNKCYK